jgi:hypothetical protein
MYDFPADPSAGPSLKRWRFIKPFVLLFAGIIGLIFTSLGFRKLMGSKRSGTISAGS